MGGFARREGRGGAYSFVACLSPLTIDHASLSRRSAVSLPNRDTSNISALITLFAYIYNMETFLLSHPLPVSPPWYGENSREQRWVFVCVGPAGSMHVTKEIDAKIRMAQGEVNTKCQVLFP